MERTYLPGPEDQRDSNQWESEAPTGVGFGFVVMLLVLVLAGGGLGYLWHQQRWWPLTGEVLESSQLVWCDSHLELVYVAAKDLGFLPLDVIGVMQEGTGKTIAGSVEDLKLDLFLLGPRDLDALSGTGVSSPSDASLLTVGQNLLYIQRLGSFWVFFREPFTGWEDPEVIEACAAAYEAFR